MARSSPIGSSTRVCANTTCMWLVPAWRCSTVADYETVLDRAKQAGATNADHDESIALFGHGPLQTRCGAAPPHVVFEGAVKKGLGYREFGHLASTDPSAVADLMWV